MGAFRFFLIIFAVWLGCGPAMAERRVALVIGNGAYQHVPRLKNPANDASDVAAALKRDGFDAILAIDLERDQLVEATIKFAKAARTADVAVVYYSGHALQFGGINYLAPIDARLADESDLRRLVKVEEIIGDLQQAKSLRILVLDSCRNNPLVDELKRSIGTTRALPMQRGLAKMDAPQGMIIAYATQAGQTADDGSGRNSPYTAAFLKHIEDNEEIGTIFRQISEDVYETTNRTQLPELSLSIIGRFYLRGKLDISTKPTTPGQPLVGEQSLRSEPENPLGVDCSKIQEIAEQNKLIEAQRKKIAVSDKARRCPLYKKQIAYNDQMIRIFVGDRAACGVKDTIVANLKTSTERLRAATQSECGALARD